MGSEHEGRRGEGQRLPWLGGRRRDQAFTEEALLGVEQKAEELKTRFSPKGPLGRFVEDVQLLGGLLRDVVARRYREVPWWGMAAISGMLLYVINPFDLVPDALPIVGYLDDATVFATALLLVEQQLHVYRDWREELLRGAK